MKKTAWAAFMLAAAMAPAFGAGYGFLNVGIDYFNQGRHSDAVVWFDKAIAAGDLVPDQMRAAYYGRGMSQAAQQDFTGAVSSFTSALAVKPGDGAISRARGAAYVATGQFEKAFPDLQAAHLKYPNNLLIDFQTGLLAWRLGLYEQARTVFARLTKREPTAWLWLQLASVKLGVPGAAIEGEKIDAAQWPNPLKALYAGQVDDDAVLKAQRESSAADAEACDANFYVGEWRLVHGDIPAGRAFIQKAVQVCTGPTNERAMALFEAKKLADR